MEVLKYILSSIIVVATPLLFVKILLNPELRNDKSKIIVAVLVSLISSILIYNYTDGILKTCISMVVYMVLIYNFYEISKHKTFIVITFYVLMLIIPELLILLILCVFDLSKEYFYNIFAGSFVSNLIIYLSVLIITMILKNILRKITQVDLNISFKIIVFLVLTILSILVFFFDIISSFRIGTKVIFYLIAVITFISALIIVVYEESKNIKLQSKYDKLLEFMEIYEIELENERILRHEYKNQLITIKSKIVDRDNNKNIINYINSIIRDEIDFVQEEYIKFQYLPSNGLKALLYFKVSDAKKKGIEVNVNISSSIKESFLRDLTIKEFKELGILLGIYLDNAIDASQESNKKVLGIEAYDTNEGIELIISNSYKGKIETDKVGNIHFSTKGKGRGYGLLLVKKILKSNSIFKCEREITGSLYIQNIIVKNKNLD